MTPLKINPEYVALVPRPTKEEYEALEADIVAKGEATEPIVTNENGVILDGHTRYEICTKHSLSYRTDERRFDSELDEKIYVITVNLKRRHITDMQKILMAKPLEDLIAEKARRRELAGTLASNEARGRTTELTARAIGVSKSTYERGRKIRDEGKLEEIQEACRKPREVNKVYCDMQRRQLLERALSKPEQTEEIRYNTYQIREKGGVYLGGQGVSWLTNYIIEEDAVNNLCLVIRLAGNGNYSVEERTKQALIWNALYHLTDGGIENIVEKTTPGPAKERVEYIAHWLKWLRESNKIDAEIKQLTEYAIEELYKKYQQITVEFTDGYKAKLELDKFPAGTFHLYDKEAEYKKGGKKWIEAVLKQYILPQIAEQLVEEGVVELDGDEEAES